MLRRDGAAARDDARKVAAQKIACPVGAAPAGIRQPLRQRKQHVNDLPWNGGEASGQRAAVALGIEIGRSAEQHIDDDVEGRPRHRRRRIDLLGPAARAPAVHLTLRHRCKNRHEGQQGFVAEDRRNCAPLPAPIGVLGEKDRVGADRRGKGPPRHRIASEDVSLTDQDFADQVRLGDEDDVAPGPAEVSDALLVGRARNCLDVIAKCRRQPAQAKRPFRRFERNEVGIGVHANVRL